VRQLHAVVDSAADQNFFAPVELERLALLETKRNKGTLGIAFAGPPLAGEVGDTAISAIVTIGLDLLEQGLGREAVLLAPMGLGLEYLFQRGVVGRQFVGNPATYVARWCYRLSDGFPEPFTQRVTGQSRAL
jgi:hypothetical protein